MLQSPYFFFDVVYLHNGVEEQGDEASWRVREAAEVWMDVLVCLCQLLLYLCCKNPCFYWQSYLKNMSKLGLQKHCLFYIYCIVGILMQILMLKIHYCCNSGTFHVCGSNKRFMTKIIYLLAQDFNFL